MSKLSTLTSLDSAAGADVSQVSSLDNLLNKANFDFTVERTTLHDPEGEHIPGKYLLRREDTDHVLGVVGGKYHPVSTRAMLEPFYNLVKKHGGKYENAGVVQGGKKCWVSATLPGSIKVPGRSHDIIEQRLVCLIHHDGGGRNSYFPLAHRVACNNQLRLLTKAAQHSQFGFTHTKNWEESLKSAIDGFQAAIEARNEFARVVERLSTAAMDDNEVRAFSKRLYRLDDKKAPSKQAEARGEQLVDLFKHGAGNMGKTRWDALNAVTELLDHHSSKRYKTDAHRRASTQNRFISNSLRGYGDTIKQRAVRLLTNTEIKLK